jgi:23S rRNA pseudouridine1911/1915/1917 synthase
MKENIQQTLIIPDEFGGMRLDQALAKLLPDFSRTQIQEWLKNSEITLNGKQPRARDTVIGGETIVIQAAQRPQPQFTPQSISLDIIYEDEAFIILNKPAGMVVHPAAGNTDNTLLNALLYHDPSLQNLPRAGIIHRLDKETTGLLVVAKTAAALTNLSQQIRTRSVSRIYQAIICGVLISGGTINQPIGRHPVQRKQMAVVETGKPAVTHYRVIEHYRAHTRIKVQLETGRTHQIRVHMAHIHYPVFGDPTYSGHLRLPKGASPELMTQLRQFKRQALHAYELGFIHPLTQKPVRWQIPIPSDMQELINALKQDAIIHE